MPDPIPSYVHLLRAKDLFDRRAYARRWRDAPVPAVPGCFTLLHTRPVGSGSSRQAEAPLAG